MLKMKSACERCGKILSNNGAAFICSYECTFCMPCTGQLNQTCPNCDGELVSRPWRDKSPTATTGSLLGRKLRGLFGGG